MKIWLPTTKGNSGTDIFSLRLSAALLKRGIEAKITWFHTYYQFAPFLLNLVSIPQGIQIIHANSWNAFAFKRPKIPLIATEYHCVVDPSYRPHKSLLQHIFHEGMIRRYEISSFRSATKVTTLSQFTELSLKTALGLMSVTVIPGWIDTSLFTPELSKRQKKNSCFQLLFIGNLSKRKGADLLNPIMQKLGPSFQLKFTAGLRNTKIIPKSANMLPLGRLDEQGLLNAYRQCDALLFPTRFEGFGYAALEAMACGKPVIASNNTALPEVVEHGVTGLLCPTGDVDAFVSACRQLAENPTACRLYGDAGRQRAEALFSEEVVVPRYIDLYERLLA